MFITLTHNGFHGYKKVSFFSTPTKSGNGCYNAVVSIPVAKRLNSQICGKHDCTCGECLIDISQALHEGQDYAIVTYVSDDGGKTGEIYGRYIQAR